jgi:kynurenine formamidase
VISRRSFVSSAWLAAGVQSWSTGGSSAPTGRQVVDLSQPIGAPISRRQAGDGFHIIAAETHLKTHARSCAVGAVKSSWSAETLLFDTSACGTCLDGLAAVGRDLTIHGPADASAVSSSSGVEEAVSVTAIPPDLMVTDAVLLDIAATTTHEPLPSDFRIEPSHLAAAAAASGIAIDERTTVLIRTGWGTFHADAPERYHGAERPGLTPAAAEWLVARGVRLVGIDAARLDCSPSPRADESHPAQAILHVDGGALVLRNLNLEAIGGRRHAFTLVAAPLNFARLTSCPVRALAIMSH